MLATLRALAVIMPVLAIALAIILGTRGSDSSALAVETAEIATEAELTEAEAALEDELARIGEGFAGKVGIAVRPVERDRTIHFDGLTLYPQHSVSKLWVALAAFDAAERGDLALSDSVTVGREDLTLFYQPIRKEVLARGSVTTSIEDLLFRALARSDNTANDVVLRRSGGPAAVRAVLEDKEIEGIRFGPGERAMQSAIAGLEWRQSYSLGRNFYEARDAVPDDLRRAAYEAYLADPVDGAMPVAVAVSLARLASGELLSADSTARFLSIMEQTRSGPRRLKGGLPEGWKIAHKTGTGQALVHEQTGYNDVGILTAPDGRRYAVVVMIARTEEKVPERQAMMHEVVAAVAEYHAASAD